MGLTSDSREEALNQVGHSLRALAANLVCIVRGTGKPLELGRDVDAFTAALGAFEGTTGEHPKAWEFAEMLRVDLEAKGSTPTSEEEMAVQYALHAIVQASLQLATARLLRKETEAAEAYEIFTRHSAALKGKSAKSKAAGTSVWLPKLNRVELIDPREVRQWRSCLQISGRGVRVPACGAQSQKCA